MSETTAPGAAAGAPQRTDPKSFVVQGLAGLRNAIFPVIAIFFAMREDGALALLAAAAVGAAIAGIASVVAYLHWSRFTYRINPEDIRVEAGVLSRTARSVPFERIQDVSLEQSLIPRLFGLVAVKFETGSGGGEDITLAFLDEAEGERLREVVRERKDVATALSREAAAGETQSGALPASEGPQGELLFAMNGRRLFTFGLFEFSLAVFAVLAGLAQYAETFVSIELLDPDLWRRWFEEQQGVLGSLGPAVQVLSAVAGLLALLVVGSVTGLVRTFLRDWDFRLEKTLRGFRRRRGLFTRTDVVMPVHRVQAVRIKTGMIRYRFGWRALKFVSLAQDAGSANHDVAPFARMEEIAPIIRAAGFVPASRMLDWKRTDPRYWIDQTLIAGGIALAAALVVGWLASPGFAVIPLVLAAVIAAANWYGYAVHAHALDDEQVYVRRGWLSPDLQIGSRVKLHSVEIVQGPIAQRRGYANFHLGLAGGNLAISGLPLERALALRRAILASIAEKDFSEIHRASEPRLAA